MVYVDFVSELHKKSDRDYRERVLEFEKAHCAKVAKKWDYDYWDGARQYGFGGYHYDGRWRVVAERMADYYNLKAGDHILDIGCGKGYLLYDILKISPDADVYGLDISEYAVNNSKEEIRHCLQVGNATKLPWPDNYFDLVVSINTLHCLHCFDIDKALREMNRVGKANKYLCVESYRNETEKANLLYWKVTCEMFNTPKEWDWWFTHTGYNGDYSYIYF